jgi:hypothetical protein
MGCGVPCVVVTPCSVTTPDIRGILSDAWQCIASACGMRHAGLL